MPQIKDYQTLSQAIIDFSHRTELAGLVDYYIQMAETTIYRDIFLANMGDGIKQMESQLAGQTDPVAGTMPIPSDYLSLKAMQVVDASGAVVTLDYKDSQWIYDNYPMRSSDKIPSYVARDGTNFVFGPYPDQSYTIQGWYYAAATLLSPNNPSTWLVTSDPDLMLAACLKEVGPFLRDDKALSMWTGIYNAKLAALIAKDMADRWSGATMQIETG